MGQLWQGRCRSYCHNRKSKSCRVSASLRALGEAGRSEDNHNPDSESIEADFGVVVVSSDLQMIMKAPVEAQGFLAASRSGKRVSPVALGLGSR